MKNKIFFTPGPSELYFTVFDHVKKAFSNQIPSISHRSIEFEKIYNTCIENLKVIFDLPNDYNIAFISSANEVWERIIQNLIYDNSVHLINGSFSQKFYDFTKMYRVNSEGYFFTLWYFVLDDRNKFNSGIIALDCTSGSPSIAFKAENVDTFYFSVQKCFGLPSGLGVWVYNEKCIKANEKKIELGEITGSYHSLQKIHQMSLKSQTPATPNILGIYLLMKVSEDIIRNGMNLLIKDTNYKSTLIYDTIKKHDLLECSIMNQEIQSKTIIVADTKISSQIFIDKLKAKNLIIGKGYGKNDNQIRIANFPTHSKESIELLCDEIKLIQ